MNGFSLRHSQIESPEDEIQFLTFEAGNERCGIPISIVREVIEYERISEVPLSSPVIRGIMNLRGSVVTVIDLSMRLYGYSSVKNGSGCVIIVEMTDEGEPILIGMLIDRVFEVISADKSIIEDEPEFGAKIDPSFISGIAKMPDGFTIILRCEKMLELDVLSDINAEAGIRESANVKKKK